MGNSPIEVAIAYGTLCDSRVRMVWQQPEFPYLVFKDICRAMGVSDSDVVLKALPVDMVGKINAQGSLVKAAFVQADELALLSAAGLCQLMVIIMQDPSSKNADWAPERHPQHDDDTPIQSYRSSGDEFEVFRKLPA